MNENQLTPENVLSAQHAEWLKHPVTIQALKHLETHKQMFIDAGVNNSASFTMEDNYFRLQAHGVKTLSTAISTLAITKNFVNLAQSKDK